MQSNQRACWEVEAKSSSGGGVATAQREVITMYDGWRRVGGLGREVFELVDRIWKQEYKRRDKTIFLEGVKVVVKLRREGRLGKRGRVVVKRRLLCKVKVSMRC